MRFFKLVILGNLEQLSMGKKLLQRLSDEDYARDALDLGADSVGAHIRHVLEHYSCLLDGLAEEQIDYDARGRDKRISNDRSSAISRFEQIRQKLNQLNRNPARISVKSAVSETGSPQSEWCESSCERELQYMLAHTVHHYALIAMILRSRGHVVERGFGIAPSTLRHLNPSAANGRE